MKRYESPEIEVIAVAVEDVITVSGNAGDGEWGGTGGGED